jgi:pilus assembly protein Flp/PilA
MLYMPREEGQGLVEYALILVLVAVVVIIVLVLLGPAIGNIFSNIVSSLWFALFELKQRPGPASGLFFLPRIFNIHQSDRRRKTHLHPPP